MQGLGGTAPGLNRGATMSGNKAGSSTSASPVKYMLVAPNQGSGGPVSATFTADAAGLYQFALWGAGGGDGATIGGGAGLAIKTVRLRLGDAVSLSTGRVNTSTPANRISSATFPDGSTMSANGGGEPAGGTATGGDINVSGSAGSGGVGGQAGSYGNFAGGVSTSAPGGGGLVSGTPNSGAGVALVLRVGD